MINKRSDIIRIEVETDEGTYIINHVEINNTWYPQGNFKYGLISAFIWKNGEEKEIIHSKFVEAGTTLIIT